MYDKFEKEAHATEVESLMAKIDEAGEELLAKAVALMESGNYAGAVRVYSDVANIFGASTIGETARAGANEARQAMYAPRRETASVAQPVPALSAPLAEPEATAPDKAEQEALAKSEFEALLEMIRAEVKRTSAAAGGNGTVKVDAATVISGMAGTTREEAMAKIELILACYPDTSCGERVRKLKEKL